MRDELVKYGKLLHKNGLAIGSGGNISLRKDSVMLIKKKGVDMSEASVKDYLRVPFNGKLPECNDISSETPFHIACYNAREDISAVIHAHSPFLVAASEKLDELSGIAYESDYIFKRPVPVIDYISPGSNELAEAIAEKIKLPSDAVLMRRHGALTAGKDLKDAFIRMLALERACKTYMLFTLLD